jgi:two-component system response regulator AtoC
VLVVDDDPIVSDLLAHWLEAAGYGADVCADGEAALTSLGRVRPDVVVLDLSLPGLDGLEVLVRIKHAMPRTPIIILTGTTEIATVVSAMQGGAYNYLAKPVERDRLLTTVSAAIDHGRLTERIATLERAKSASNFEGIIGNSSAMKALFREMDRAATADVTVLVRGESGTGKELVARALHDHSARKKGPFIALNCAAIPETLQESELFGHEKGAFTGALARHFGRFEQAHGGTLFLDEIGEIAPSLQAKLLRVFQERRFHRVGGTQEVKVDVRIIAATHRDLFADVGDGRFREDLYYRLAVFELEVPPLRERIGDLPRLVSHLVNDLTRKHGRSTLKLAAATLESIERYPWPGNVRELQNALERAVVVATDGEVRPSDLPRRVLEPRQEPTSRQLAPAIAASQETSSRPDGDLRATSQTPGPRTRTTTRVKVQTPAPGTVTPVSALEKRAIQDALERTGYNLTEACRLLGIPRTTMYRKLKKHGIQL